MLDASGAKKAGLKRIVGPDDKLESKLRRCRGSELNVARDLSCDGTGNLCSTVPEI